MLSQRAPTRYILGWSGKVGVVSGLPVRRWGGVSAPSGCKTTKGVTVAEFQNIVYCTDFSENAGKAFGKASAIASLTGGHLHVLHVVPEAVGERERNREIWYANDVKRAKEIMTQTCVAPFGVQAESEVRYGKEPVEILGFAEEKGADLIVMGARGSGALTRLLGGGSVADKVVRNAKIPVLVVPF
jgi:nucleotide-binding universal stress UspA family protein